MKKSNQKGFMLVEAFVVSTVVLGVLVFMFVQLRTVVSGFDRSFSYNTVPGIYIANELGDFIVSHDYDNLKQKVNVNGYIVQNIDSYIDSDYETNILWNEMLKAASIKNVVISTEDAAAIKTSNNVLSSVKLEDYIKFLSVDSNSNQYRIIVEFNDDTYASVKLT